MDFQLAQLNIGRLLHPLDHPQIREFVDGLERINMSVWKSPEDLKQFVYRSGHLEYYVKRSEWFEKPGEAHYVLWWVREAHIPTLEEARQRLEHYRAHGASPH